MTYKGPSFVNSTQTRGNTYFSNIAFEEISIVVTLNFKVLFLQVRPETKSSIWKNDAGIPSFRRQELGPLDDGSQVRIKPGPARRSESRPSRGTTEVPHCFSIEKSSSEVTKKIRSLITGRWGSEYQTFLGVWYSDKHRFYHMSLNRIIIKGKLNFTE